MYKFIFMVFIALTFFSPSVSKAQINDEAAIAKAQAWLSNLDKAKARFQQIDYQGNILNGTFYINRPGRLRFEYDAPVKDYIVADGYLIHFYDGVSGQVSSGPIGSTLADFILRDGNRFDEQVIVKNIRERDGKLQITVTQRDNPAMGELILNFTQEPFNLKSWQIIDAQGLTTDIILHNLNNVDRLNPRLFRMDNMSLNE
jgi:outer membrane lipoprotein-sorting protein